MNPQTEFTDLRSAGKVTCVKRDGAKQRLGCVDYELDLILQIPAHAPHRLTGVLNLAGPEAKRNEHQVFIAACLDEFLAQRMVRRNDDELCVMIFGALQKQHGIVSLKRVYRSLNIRHDHLYSFTHGRRPALPLGRSVCRRGPGGSAVVTWGALVAFVAQRRIA